MKTPFFLFPILLLPFVLPAQQTIDSGFIHDDIYRSYILYVPANYTGDTPVPLVFNFHGYGSNANDQMLYGDFRSIADTAGFLVVHPLGTFWNNLRHWNVGGWTLGSTVDDVGFTAAMIDTIASQYNINLERVYSTGMSNGGYMSFLLACQLGDRIAAIASVTGSMTPETFNECLPDHPTPIMQIHGTEDWIVPYNGLEWSEPIEEVMQYWVDFNNCNPTPTLENVPDISPTDGSTVEHFVYYDCSNNVNAEHFKVTGAGHTWPGTFFTGPDTNQDIDASDEIWRFFSRYDIHGLIDVSTQVEAPTHRAASIEVFPNPATGVLRVSMNKHQTEPYQIWSPLGYQLDQGIIEAGQADIDLSSFSAGMYFLKVKEQLIKIFKVN